MELDARRMDTALHVYFSVVPYSCAGHLVPYVAAVKDSYPVTCLYSHDAGGIVG